MKNYIKTVVNALQTWVKGYVSKEMNDSVADWSQNDSRKSNYIKNRPFYEDGDTVHKIDEKYINIADEEDTLKFLMDLDVIEDLLTDENGSVYTDENGNVYML